MQWNDIRYLQPPTGIPILVVKYYLDAKFDMEKGGYTDEQFRTKSFATVDVMYGNIPKSHSGGIVTHWMELPDLPLENDDN